MDRIKLGINMSDKLWITLYNPLRRYENSILTAAQTSLNRALDYLLQSFEGALSYLASSLDENLR